MLASVRSPFGPFRYAIMALLQRNMQTSYGERVDFTLKKSLILEYAIRFTKFAGSKPLFKKE